MMKIVPLFLLAALTTSMLYPAASHAEETSKRRAIGYTDSAKLSAEDIDRLLLEDSDNGVADAYKTLKILDRELESAMPKGLERDGDRKMAKKLAKRLRKPEVINYHAVEPSKKKKRRS